ncbi:MAG: hypothetical protein QXF49_00280 [Thermosphaera sp.]
MTGFNRSEFKMFEKAPYETIDERTEMELITSSTKELEKIYGKVFTVKIIEYALRTVERFTGERSSVEINSLDELKDYLLLISNKLPVPSYYVMFWAQYVTEKKFEGGLGVGYQISHSELAKKAISSDGIKPEQAANIEEALALLRKLAVNMKIAPIEFGYKIDEDGNLYLYHGGCAFLKGCKMSMEKGVLHRPDGRVSCGVTIFVCQFLKSATKQEWDHTLLEFNEKEKYCIVKCTPI